MVFFRPLITVTFFLLGYAAFGVRVDSGSAAFDLNGNHYSVYEDSTGELNFQQFTEKWEAKKLYPSSVKKAENSQSAYWLVIPFTNSSYQNWVLEAKDHHTDEIAVYLKEIRQESGASKPFKSRSYKLKNIVVDLPNTRGEEVMLFIRIKARNQVGFEFSIKEAKQFVSYATTEYYLLGFYYGVLLIMALYNVLLFLSARERVYLWYILYVLACVLVSLEEDGLGFQFLWPSVPKFNYLLTNLFAPLLLMVSFMVYSLSFLGLQRKSNWSYKILWGITLGYVFAQIGNVFFFPDNVVVNDYFFLPFLAVFIIAIRRYQSGDRYSRYFILGNAFVFASVIINFLRGHYLIPANIITVYSFNIGVLIEIVVLSFALGDRIRMLKSEKEKSHRLIIEQLNENKLLQNKVNRELEEKVQQRTRELEDKTTEALEANEKLAELRDQLIDMNEQLDKDNWHLTKGIKQQSRARLKDEALGFEEFNALYPDDLSCLKELERVKWRVEFMCRKCGHQGFSKKAKLLTRKCSQCGTEESATSRTLFHGTRMALPAAFYIAYLEINNPSKLSIEELSKLLGIHRNTCSKFKAKVSAHLEELSIDKPSRSWGDLLLVS